MATVDGLTKARMLAIEGASVVSGAVDAGTGHLLLTKHDGTVIDAGYVFGTVGPASTTVAGIVELATNAETSTGTDAVRAITPAALKSVTDAINSTITSGLAGKQAADADLATIAALAPAANDILQFISGAWANRTTAQLKTSLTLVKGDVGLGNVDNTSDVNKPVSTAQQTALNAKKASFNYSGAAYASVNAGNYTGPNDPGAVADGSVWFVTAT
jgi:hypothetical protein